MYATVYIVPELRIADIYTLLVVDALPTQPLVAHPTHPFPHFLNVLRDLPPQVKNAQDVQKCWYRCFTCHSWLMICVYRPQADPSGCYLCQSDGSQGFRRRHRLQQDWRQRTHWARWEEAGRSGLRKCESRFAQALRGSVCLIRSLHRILNRTAVSRWRKLMLRNRKQPLAPPRVNSRARCTVGDSPRVLWVSEAATIHRPLLTLCLLDRLRRIPLG